MLYESFKDIDRSLVQVGGAVPLLILSWRGRAAAPPAPPPPIPASLAGGWDVRRSRALKEWCDSSGTVRSQSQSTYRVREPVYEPSFVASHFEAITSHFETQASRLIRRWLITATMTISSRRLRSFTPHSWTCSEIGSHPICAEILAHALKFRPNRWFTPEVRWNFRRNHQITLEFLMKSCIFSSRGLHVCKALLTPAGENKGGFWLRQDQWITIPCRRSHR